MDIKYGRDKTKEFKDEILKKNTIKPQLNMKKKTPYIMDESTYYHSFMKG